MDTSSLIISIVTSFVVFVILVLLFTWLSRRPLNYGIYYPNRLVQKLGPPENANKRRPFDWIVEAWRAKEEDVIAVAGLDAAVYLFFIRSMLTILVCTAGYSLPVLVAIVGADNKKALQAESPSPFDNLAMGKIQQRSDRLWAFVIGAYWLSLCTYFVLRRSYRHVVDLRARDEASPKAKPEHFAVIVRDLPRPSADSSYAEEVDTLFRRLHPATYVQSLVVTDTSKVSRRWKKVQKYKRKLARAEVELAKKGERPLRRSGWMELGGPKVDAIDFYKERVKEREEVWKAERTKALAERQRRAAFVFFNSRASAASAGQMMYAKYADKWTVAHAPDPRAVAWDNLDLPMCQRLLREFVVFALVFVMICCYMIPIGFVSALISSDQLAAKLPFLKPLIAKPVANRALQAYLPQLALLLFMAVLPFILRILSKAQGLASLAEVQRSTASKYFYFIVINVFLGVSFAGSIFSTIVEVIEQPKKVITYLSDSLPQQSSFFITYVALRLFVGYGFELSRLVPLGLYHLKCKFLLKTEDERRKAWNPGPLRYDTLVPADMLIVTVALCYSIIAPMILPFAIAYFALAWLVMRNQVLNVYVPSFESSGRMWPHIHARIVASLFVSQLTMFGYFTASLSTRSGRKFLFSAFMIPLPFATLLFAYICNRFYYPAFEKIPICDACDDVKEMPSIQTIVDAYTPTCLMENERSHDTDKFEDALSNLPSRAFSGEGMQDQKTSESEGIDQVLPSRTSSGEGVEDQKISVSEGIADQV